MNLTKLFRIAAVSFAAALGFASPAQAAVTAAFSAGASCGGATSANYTIGSPIQVSLCMTTTVTATCGYTAVLQSAAAQGGRFQVTGLTQGSGFTDTTYDLTNPPLPLSIGNPPIVSDLGATGSGPLAVGSNQLLATYTLLPQATANSGPYVISLNSVSVVAVDADGTCGATTVPTEAPITASFTLNQNPLPAFSSLANTSFANNTANSFTVVASGAPTVTLSVSGALPAGVTFTPATGVLAGTPSVATPPQTFPLVFSATNGSGTTTQNFTLTVSGQASQSINFTNPGQQTFSSVLVPLTATASSGLPITFSSQSPFVCTVSSGNVTMISTGTCVIAANQAGNATYLPAATATQSFGIVATVPGAPTIGAASVGNTQLTVSFTPPTSTGGSPILSYTATCGGISANGNSSPIAVTGLTNGTPYSCTVSATNLLGTGPSSGVATGTPNAVALALVAVHSRKTHGSAGVFNLPIDTTVALISGNVTVEPRLSLAAGHQIVFEFNSTVTSVTSASTLDSASAVGIGSPAVAFAGNEVTVTLTGAVLDNKRLTVQLTGVNGTLNTLVHIGFLVGDVTNSRVTNGTDILQVKGRSVSPTDTSNFIYDINASGSITGTDILQVKGRSISNLNP